MSERRYTVSEIDALRSCHTNKYLYGTYSPGSRASRSYYEKEMATVVEQMVRTSMLAGHTAADLLDSEQPG